MQIFLVFLSFATILYWILQIAQVSFITPVAPFFEAIKEITHIFYKRVVTIDEVSLDFSFLIVTFVMLLLVAGIKFIIEELEVLEKKYDNLFYRARKKEEDLFNAALAQENLIGEYKNNKILILINFSLKNLSKNKLFDRDFNEGIEEKQRELLEEAFKDFDVKYERKLLNEGVLLILNAFDNVDGVISYTEHFIKELKYKYYQEKWQVKYLFSLDVFADKNEVISKARDLVLINKVDLQDEIICTSAFKQRYLLIKKPKYNIEDKGNFSINEETKELCVLKSNFT